LERDDFSPFTDPPFTDVETIGDGTFSLAFPKLGEGGQASVYRAQEISDARRQVAVKIVECPMEDLNRGKPSILEKFQSEARTWNQFSTSSYVVKLFYTFRYRIKREDKAVLCFVMEYAELGDLSRNLAKRHLFASRRKDLYAFLRCIASALKEGHDKDITHGDIKPHNVLLFKSDGRIIPKVMDFGLGISTSEDVAKYGGTPEYLAPERFGSGGVEGDYKRPDNVDEAKLSDIYSLGVLFFEIISGERPYQADRSLVDREKWREYAKLHSGGKADFNKLIPNGGEALTELVKRMMTVSAKSNHRPPLREIILKLERMLQDSTTLAAREQECPIAIRSYRWNPQVHKILGGRLYYYFIKGRSPDGDPKWFKNHFGDVRIRSFSFYNILGGYDYVLRLWVKSVYAEEVDKVIETFKQQHRTDYLKFMVNSPDPFGHGDAFTTLPYSDEDSLLTDIEACANAKDKNQELENLKSKQLVGSLLSDFPPDSIRFFLTIAVSGSVNDAMLRMYSGEIRKHLEQHTAAEQISVYIGSGAFQILVKFRLKRFQDFRKIFEVFKETCEYVRVGDSVLNSQTFVELDERGIFESDDGSIVSDLVKRIDPEG
jgi:serine/threonine protein kinase